MNSDLQQQDLEFWQRMAYYAWTEWHVRPTWRDRWDTWIAEPWHQVALALFFVGGCLTWAQVGGAGR